MFAALVAAATLLATRSPKPPEAHVILASVTLTGAGQASTGAPPPPPPATGQLDFSKAANSGLQVLIH